MSEPLPGELIRDQLIPAKKIASEARRRLADYLIMDVKHSQISAHEADGWVLHQKLKFKAKMRRPKPHDTAFEDKVWATCARLGFTHLNADRGFKLRYGNADNQLQQVDVFAADDEVALIIECKSTETVKSGQFKKEIEAITGQRAGIISRLRREYPQRKVRFVLATNNYGVSKEIAARIKQADIFHLPESTVDYFLGLADHLGAAAKYQLLGALFAGQKIPNMDAKVPAIRSSMGGLTYYSFTIEPERLLKMSYVLHQNQANKAMMPTYQRLIKKSRLKKVANFVDIEHGFFPNSIIVNVEREGRNDLQFDQAGKNGEASNAKSKIGILHLPQVYRAAYLIDGQHRLYGYANSARAATDLIPVVAFVNLDRDKQVELFVQINENQQAVPTHVRNTLYSDLYWESDDLSERAKALRLRIAQDLGEEKTSPLFNRVIIGENTKTDLRCISMESIQAGLARGNFIGRFTKKQTKSLGTFHAGDNQTTAELLVPFLELALEYFRDGLRTQFNLGGADGGFVFMNPGIEAFLRLLSDIVDHVVEHAHVAPLTTPATELLDRCKDYLDPLIEHLDGLSADEAAEYRRMYGSGGPLTFLRRMQTAIRDARPEFSPPGLDEWHAAQDKQFNLEATDIVKSLEAFMKHDIRKRLEDEYGSNWEREGIPRKVRESTGLAMVKLNLERDADAQLTEWDCMYLIDLREVLTYSDPQWTRLYEKRYTRPGDENKNGRKARTEWLVELNTIRNDLSHDRGITADSYAFLIELRSWLLNDEIDNDLA